MFTGIIESQTTVADVFHQDNQSNLLLMTDFDDVSLGESIAVNGVCLTVAEMTKKGELVFYLNPETLNKTALSEINKGDFVNLERAMKLGDRFSGHWVQGHVDGTAKLIKLIQHQDTHEMHFLIHSELGKYTVEKGSVALDGVSLTINNIEDIDEKNLFFSVQIIPHTWKYTRLSRIELGQKVNLEVDVLAKYVEKLCQNSLKK